MKKKITAIMAAAVLCLSLAACGGSSSEAASEATSEEVSEASSQESAAETTEASVSETAQESEAAEETAEEAAPAEASGKPELTIGALTLFTASNLDPAAEWNGWFDSMFGIGETLFRLDDSMTPQPYLAESYDYDMDKTWTITLRDDVNYTNGEKMTGETVKASLERTLEVCERAESQLHIDKVEADGQNVIITTTQPMPALLNELCDPICVIEYVDDSVDYENAPVLTGPFITEEFAVNDIMVVTAFDGYWGGEPALSKVTFKTYADGDALTMAMQKGEVDAAYDLPETAITLFETDGFKVNKTEGPRGQAIFFNEESENVSDTELRVAIDMAIDREGFVKMMNGTAEVNYGMFPASMTCGGTDRLNLRVTEETGLDEAAKVLADAGYADTDGDGVLDKDGKNVSLTMAIGSGSNEALFAQALKSNLKQLGIEMEIKPYENTNSAYADGDFDIGLSNLHMAPTGNPQYFFDLFFLTGSSYNQGFYSSEEVDEMIGKLASTYDPGERDDLAFAIEQKILDDMYYIVYANKDFNSVSKDTVSGLIMNPSEYYIVDKDTAIG